MFSYDQTVIIFWLIPSEEFGNWMSRKDGGSVSIGNTMYIRLKIFVSDNGQTLFESGSISSSIEAISLQIFGVCISR